MKTTRVRWMEEFAKLGVAALLLSGPSTHADDGFTGAFDFNLWTYSSGGAGASYSADSLTLSLQGSQNFNDIVTWTRLTTNITGSYLLSFDWSYQTNDPGGPQYDPGGYTSGTDNPLSASFGGSNQSGSASNVVFDGGLFGFYVNSDNYRFPQDDGYGTLTITNFHFTPYTPITPTWTGLSSGNWNAAENWNSAIPNGTAAYAEFGNSGRTDVLIDTAVQLHRLRFNSDAPAYTINIEDAPGRSLSFYGPGIDNLSGQPQSIVNTRDLNFFNAASAGNAVITSSGANAKVSFEGNASAGSATLVASNGAAIFFRESSIANGAAVSLLNGNLDISTVSGFFFSLGSLSGSGTVQIGSKHLILGTLNTDTEIGAVIQDQGLSGALTKTGSGTMTLSGNSTFTGGLYLDEGTVAVAILPLAGEPSPIGQGTLQFYGGGLRYTGPSITTTHAFNADAGGGTIDVTQPGTVLNIASGFWGFNDSNPANAVIKTGPGTLIFSGPGDNAGLPVIVNAGTLVLAKASEMFTHAVSQLLTINGGTVQLGGTGGDQILDSAILTLSGGTLALGTFNESVGVVRLQSGSITGSTGVLTGSSYDVRSGNVTAILGGSGALTKSTAGTVTLSGANTYSGGSTISAGILEAGHDSALGSGTVSLNGGTLQGSGSSRTLSNAITLNSNSSIGGATALNLTGTLTNSGGNRTLTLTNTANATFGGINLSNNNTGRTLTFDGAGNVTVAGVIANRSGGGGGAGSVVKNGAGRLLLTGANTFAGGLTINSGTVRAETNAAALGAGALTLGGGTLELAGASVSFDRNTTVSANATIVSDRTSSSATSSTHVLGTLGIGGQTLALNRGSRITGAGVGGLTFGATTLTAGGSTFDTGENTLLTLGALGGNFSFVKQGLGQMVLNSASNRTSGGTTLAGGILRLGVASALGTTQTTFNLNGGTLQTAGNTTNTVFNGTNVVLGGDGVISVDRVSGTANVTHQIGTLTLGSHTLTIAQGANFGTNNVGSMTAGAVTLSGNPILNLTNIKGTGVGVTTLGALNDGGSARTITKNGGGTLVLGTAAASLVNGTAVQINAGILNSNQATALGSLANVTLASGATFGVGASQTLGGLNGTGGTVSLGTNTLTVGHSTNNLNSVFAGATSATAGALIKNGSGTLTLSGNNLHTGGTTVNDGTLRIENTTGSATGSGAVVIGTSGRLTGSGTIAGSVSLLGTLAPGNSPGRITVGTMLVGSTGSYAWEISDATGTAGSAWDLVSVNGSLTFSPGATFQVFSLGLTNFEKASDFSWTVATATTGISGWETLNLSLSGFTNSYDGTFNLERSGNSLNLKYTAIPEPGAIILLAVGLAGLTIFRRRVRGTLDLW